MKKKIFVSLLPTLVLTFVCLARAQQPTKVPRIGFLTTATAGSWYRMPSVKVCES